MSATQALRYNEWKPQWSLVDFGSLEPMVRGLEYWAKKYTYLFPFTIDFLWKLAQTIQIEKYIVEDSAEAVMINSWKKLTLNIVSDKQLILNLGLNEIQNITKLELESLLMSKKTQNDWKSGNDIIWGGIDLLWMNVMQWLVSDVKFVVPSKDFILTIVTKPDECVDVYVENVTNDYDSLMIISRDLQMLWYIWKEILIKDTWLQVSWRNNWQKWFPREKLLESMMRHMIALMDWEEIDPESGVPHVWLIQCNAMFYAYHSKRNSFITND